MNDDSVPRRRPRLIHLLPLGIFLALAAVFFTRLMSGEDPSEIPSVLVGKTAPDFSLPALDGLARDGTPIPGVNTETLQGKVSLVNVFASWCAPCREEHPVLLALAQDKRYALVALNYKDKPENARRFLGELGNPFSAIGVDEAGRTAIDWGVYGVPETFVVGKDGRIAYKHVGPLTPDSVRDQLLPQVEKALGAPD
jgi:cytochrome c biogenesis protein CcmG/thiol:disulfide interchange protein DsbE